MKLPKIQELYSIFAKLSKKESAIASVTGVIILIAVLDRLIIYPISSNMGSLDRDIKEKSSSIGKSLRILSQKEKITAESAKYTAYFSSDGAKAEEEIMGGILKKMEGLANRSAVYLIDMKPAGVKDSGIFKKYSINLTCEGQMEQLADFMYNIEATNQLMVVEKYEISPKSKGLSVARCNMAISKIIMVQN